MDLFSKWDTIVEKLNGLGYEWTTLERAARDAGVITEAFALKKLYSIVPDKQALARAWFLGTLSLVINNYKADICDERPTLGDALESVISDLIDKLTIRREFSVAAIRDAQASWSMQGPELKEFRRQLWEEIDKLLKLVDCPPKDGGCTPSYILPSLRLTDPLANGPEAMRENFINFLMVLLAATLRYWAEDTSPGSLYTHRVCRDGVWLLAGVLRPEAECPEDSPILRGQSLFNTLGDRQLTSLVKSVVPLHMEDYVVPLLKDLLKGKWPFER
ncbi:MAG: hypothetical protein ACE366_03280 [Bradymonadia bacterium]